MRELEVKLYSSALPFSAESVLHLKIYLWSVECAVAFVDFVTAFAIFCIEYILKCALCVVPSLDIAHKVFRTSRKLGPV